MRELMRRTGLSQHTLKAFVLTVPLRRRTLPVVTIELAHNLEFCSAISAANPQARYTLLGAPLVMGYDSCLPSHGL